MREFVKLTECKIDDIIEREQDITDYLVEKVKWGFIGNVCNFNVDYEYCLADCESPIEQMLSLELERLAREGKLDIVMLVDVVAIERQKEINCNGNIYRADFAIYVSYWNAKKCFLIECDGYEFHQKTKEQVENDNRRTRDLQLAGYEVIRFSGTEIYHRPYQCALEVKRIIQSPAIKFLEGVINDETKTNTR